MKYYLFLLIGILSLSTFAQKPCESNPKYNEFDFWIGDWEVYGKKGNIAGHSKITKILDNCIILEEWTSANAQQGLIYKGKSYNTYNAASGQWQQTWVDNSGGTTEFLIGKFENNAMQFLSRPFKNGKETSIRRLTFYKLENGNVRQFGEISNDEGKTFTPEYDLEYRKKENKADDKIAAILKDMENLYNIGKFEEIAKHYSKNGKVISRDIEISGENELKKYWKSFENLAGSWKLTNTSVEKIDNVIWQKGTSEIKDKKNRIHRVNFTLVFIQENNDWKILQDSYW